jgi:foldase protein PrsA
VSDLVKTLRSAPIALLGLVLAVVLVASSCSSTNPVALQVGEWQLSTKTFEDQLSGWADAYEAKNGAAKRTQDLEGTTAGTWSTQYTAFILNQYTGWQLAEQAVQERGLEVTQADLDQAQSALEQAWADSQGKPLYDQLPSSYTDLAVPGIAAENVLAGDLVTAQTSDENLRKLFEATKDKYSGDLVCVSHILVFAGKPDGKTTPSDAEYAAALAKITQIEAQIKTPADFAGAAARYSDDTNSGPSGGDLGCFARGSYPTDFEDAAWSAPLGQVTPPVKTLFGYHLLLVDARGTLTFDDLKPRLAATVDSTGSALVKTNLADAATRLNISVDGRFGQFAPTGTALITTPAGADLPSTTTTSVDPLTGVGAG